MFVRKVKNRSGSFSVQVISKHSGKYKVIKSFGSAKDVDKIEQLLQHAKQYVNNPNNQPSLFPTLSKEDIAVKNAFEHLNNFHIHTVGPELIFGTLFDSIGFQTVTCGELFRHLVIARLSYPTSKLKTVDYLNRYQGIKLSEDRIYRFLDKLSSTYKTKIEEITYRHTKKLLGGKIVVIFYDMTTLYFESEDEDDLRKIGFSKDGKFQQPQIMIGLLVGKQGLPIGYDIFAGNKFEGHTLLPILKKIEQKYHFGKPIVVADSALLSKKNIEALNNANYQYILGARIKNETDEIKEIILTEAKILHDGEALKIIKLNKDKLIITYSDKRSRKDAHNRERGIKKLEDRIKSGKLTKEHITNRGYNKFLTLDGKISVTLDKEKIKNDKKWDGLKGYATNTKMFPDEVVECYHHLWQIEQAFRISKTDLRIRPVFHRLQKRIEAHICIAFVAYAIFKELERLLREEKTDLSSKRAAELTHTMYEVEYLLPDSKRIEKTLLKMDDEQQLLYDTICK